VAVSSEFFLVTLRLRLVAVRDALLPPLTSKVVKYVVGTYGPQPLRDLVAKGPGGRKPIFISMLYSVDGHPLYKRSTDEQVLSVNAGEPLIGRLSVVLDAQAVDKVVDEAPTGRFETPYGFFDVEPIDVEVVALREPVEGLGTPTGYLKLVAKTPVVVSSKILWGGDSRLAKRVPVIHRLLPSPDVVVAAALRLWNDVVPSELRFYWRDGGNFDVHVVATAASVYMAEIDYGIRPETVVVGRAGSRLRLVRGWRGWIIYRVTGRRLASLLTKIMWLATRLGLGRSRGIGFGDVEASWVKPR
jgi:CRISPR/Cas system endoribonuclease Cas6 (RAMP superfamily)